MFTCKNCNCQVGNLGGKLLVISRMLTIQRMAMCCGPSASSHGCHARGHGLGMDALVRVCSGNTNVIVDALVSKCSGNVGVVMVWAWMLWSTYALGIRMLWFSVCSGNTNVLWFGHGCFGQRMLRERECHSGLRMGALVSVCSGNTNVIMVWAWMLWSAYALGTRPSLWFGHGCFGQRMLWAQMLLGFGHGC